MKQQLKSPKVLWRVTPFGRDIFLLDAKLEEFQFHWKKYTPEV